MTILNTPAGPRPRCPGSHFIYKCLGFQAVGSMSDLKMHAYSSRVRWGKQTGWSQAKARRLVDELVCVSIEPALRCERGFIQVVALVAALARLDEHYSFLEALTVWAGEGYGRGAGAAR